MHKILDSSSNSSIISKEGVLILMDRLGTKNIWKTNLIGVAAGWDSLIHIFKCSVYQILDRNIYDVHFRVFSDTVCIAVYGGTKIQSIIDTGIFLIIFMAISLTNKINFRGCISYGSITLNIQYWVLQ